MKNDDKLRFKMTISKNSNPDLYQYIKDAGAYYGSKRMLQLSQLGLSFTRGNQVITTPQVTSVNQSASRTVSTIDSSTAEHSGYTIPESAVEAIGAMLDSLDNFGLKQSD